MSSSPLVFEPESGRYFYWGADENGRSIRIYSVEGLAMKSSTPSQAPSVPRSHPTSRPSSNTHTTTFRERRESDAVSSSREDFGYQGRTETIPIHTESQQDTSAQHQLREVRGHVPDSRGFEPAANHHSSTSYPEPRYHDSAGNSVDPGLLHSMVGLAIGPNNGGVKYTHAGEPPATFGDNVAPQWGPITTPAQSDFTSSYQGGKAGQERTDMCYVAPKEGNNRIESLDKSYKIRNYDYKKWFRVGRVFSTLWTDAMGSATNEYDSQFMSTVSVVQYGERAYSTIRRYVVVKFDPENRVCTCLPVTTYDGRGIDKRGIRLNDHGQIYSGNKAPYPVVGVEKEPLRVKLANGARDLDRRSYINYGRPYSVETHLKVKDIGELDSSSRRLLRKYYKEVNVPDDNELSDAGPPRTAEDIAADLTGMGGAVIDTPGSYTGVHPSVVSPITHESSSYVQYVSGKTGRSGYVSDGQSSFVPSSGYASQNEPTYQMGTPSVSYSKSSVYDLNHPSSASSHQLRDDRFVDSSSTVAGGRFTVLSPGRHDPSLFHKTTYTPDKTGETAPASGQYHSERQNDHEHEHNSAMSQSFRDQRHPPVASSSYQDSSAFVASSSTWYAAASSSTHQDPPPEDEEVLILPTLEEASRSYSRQSTNQNGGSRLSQRARERLRERRKDRDEEHEKHGRGRFAFAALDASTDSKSAPLNHGSSSSMRSSFDPDPGRHWNPKRDGPRQANEMLVTAKESFESPAVTSSENLIVHINEIKTPPGTELVKKLALETERNPSSFIASDDGSSGLFEDLAKGYSAAFNQSDLEDPKRLCIDNILSDAQLIGSLPNPSSQPNSEQQSRGLGRSRSSSVDTIESEAFSILSTSSSSSVANPSGGAERLSAFLSKQEWLQTLSKDAMRKVSLEKFEENFRRSLVQFSAHLKAEAASPMMIQAAGAVRRYARNAAKLIRQSLELDVEYHQESPFSMEGVEPTPVVRLQDSESEDDFEEQDDLQNLEVLLSSSRAFRLLEENLRLFVHPDHAKKALFKIWPITHLRSSPMKIEYDLEWQVPKFLKTHFPEGQELGKVLTVTGEAVNAQAQSCGDYLSSTWLDVGRILLNGLHDLLYFETEVVIKQTENASFDLKLGGVVNADDDLTSHVSVTVVANHKVHEQVASAFAWICAAIRYSPHEQVVYSTSSIEATKEAAAGPKIAIRMANLEPLQTDQPCWHPLLPHAVIAKGFPIGDRMHGKGLEISFADMTLLSQSMSFTEYDGGLIVEGLRSVLIPIGLLQDGALQWHLEYKRRAKEPKKRSVSEIFEMANISKWYRVLLPYELIEKRCFVGWTEEIAVIIGTEEFSSTNVYPSEALHGPKTRRIKSQSISIGISGLGFLGPNGSKSWQTTSVPSSITLEINKDIYDTLADDLETSILIYDTEEKIAWFLPQLSVILYITHKIITRRKYQVFDGDHETPFRFARPGADGATEAFTILQDMIQLKVRKSPTFRDDLSKTIKDICLWLDLADDNLKTVNSEFELIEGSAETSLYGFEFNEVLKMKRCIDIKQAQVAQPWTQMVRNHGVVLFCGGLGQPIIPVSSAKLCATYARVPPDRELMATTGTVLHSFLEQHGKGAKGSRLGDNVKWINEQTLVQSHTPGQKTPVFHEQSLRIIKACELDLSIRELVGRHQSSGFIFANYRSRTACSEAIAPTKLVHNQSILLNPLQNKKALTTIPTDDFSSDLSNDSDSGLNHVPLPTSSISSDESSHMEKEADLSNLQLSGTKATRTWNTEDSRQDTLYSIEFSSERQMSMASSPNVHHYSKNTQKEGPMFGSTSKDKRKAPALGKDKGFEASGKGGERDLQRKATAAEHRQGKWKQEDVG